MPFLNPWLLHRFLIKTINHHRTNSTYVTKDRDKPRARVIPIEILGESVAAVLKTIEDDFETGIAFHDVAYTTRKPIQLATTPTAE